MKILALYSGLLSLVFIFLSYKVASYRKKFKVGIGDGENSNLAKAIRVHANFIEYVPLALLLLAIFEINRGHPWVAHGAGIVLIVARVMHAYGLGKSKGSSFGRVAGTSLSWLVILLLSTANIYYYVVSSLLS